MKKLALTAFIASAFLFGTASCTSENKDNVDQAQETNEQAFEDTSMEDRKIDQSDFMTRAASDGMFEIEAGKLAQQKGQNAEVKKFGGQMVTDHQKASNELKALAQKKSITLPDSMSREHMDKLQSLRDKNGAEFDEEYVDAMVDAHDKAVSLFEDAAEDLEDAEVKAFASKTLPVLQQHREHAKTLDDKLGNTAGTNTNRATPSRQ
ncbi:DUF4142 domain-containing protein [Pontibacter qinzhouensis]|uniref:DUF4142 domain-containing protein n=1 Tax=Pontibacter qinzhouensis TaxID=2603253 RepID=A0A5C8KE65_9BACT|nr:DUF4142 domain-containing protein [Pontibacter qinzhouensis]TXK52818.1 DUF4142 domain-containing protein [Pontibacter qinzhouensis]